MTSGDGERLTAEPMVPVSGGEDAAASAAALCSDSDDLLTTRRGGPPPQPVRPTNGHVVGDATAEQSFAAVEMATAGNDDVATPPEPEAAAGAPETAPSMVTDPDEPISAVQTDLEREAAPVVVALPPEPAGPPDTEAELVPLEHQTSVATLVTEAELVPFEHQTSVATLVGVPTVMPPVLHDAAVADAEESPLVGDDAAAGEAPFVDEVPPTQAPVAAPPTGEALWVVEPAAPSNGVAVHTAATAEFPAIVQAAPADVQELPAPALTAPVLPSDEVNDIEVPLPSAAVDEQHIVIDASIVDVPFAEASTELIEAPTMEPDGGLATPFATEPIVLADPDLPAEPPAEPPAPPLAAAPPPPPAAPPPEEGEEEGATMTIIEHLEELRHRITICAISIVVGSVAGWFITPYVVKYLEGAFKRLGGQFLSLTILGPFGLELKLSFLIGFVIASPMVLYQIWGFVAPGLTRRERRYALPFSLIGSALFAGGAVTGVLIVPLAIQFLTHFFQVLQLEQVIDIDKYIMFIALIAVIFGITFELPIFMVGFSLLGVVNSRFFIQKFRIAIFVIYGAAMVITPGADLVSPLVLGTFLIVLYWLGVFLIRVIGR